MVNLAVAPVQPSNFFNTLLNHANQIEAIKHEKQMNRLSQLQIQSFPQQLQFQNSFANAKLRLLQEQASLYPQLQQSLINSRNQALNQPLSAFGKLLHDQSTAQEQYGKNSLQSKAYDAAIQKASTVMNGLQVFGPNGQLLVSQGGPQQTLGNFLKNPMMGSNRSGAGGTYVDPQTGQAISSDTMPMVTTDQTAISAVDRVIPQINNMIRTLPQFQNGWKNVLTHLEGLSNRWLGGNFSDPSEKASGLASLETAPEALLKAYGLRPSEYALTTMRKTIEPKIGETPEGYQKRILATLDQLSDFKQQSQSHLRAGFDITGNTKNPDTVQAIDPILAEINRRKKNGQWQ